MGIQIQAKLIYGIRYWEIAEEDLEEVDYLLESGESDNPSPRYDAPKSEWIVGREVYVNGRDEYEMNYQISDCIDNSHPILVHNYNLGFYVAPHVT